VQKAKLPLSAAEPEACNAKHLHKRSAVFTAQLRVSRFAGQPAVKAAVSGKN